MAAKMEFLPVGFESSRLTDGVLVADWINTIFARLNPWAAVKFHSIGPNSIWFSAGPRCYVLQFDPFSVNEFDGDGEIETDAARRVAQELDGWTRDDAGNRNPPPGYFPRRPNDDPRPLPTAIPTPAGNWQTLCDNAARVADASKPVQYKPRKPILPADAFGPPPWRPIETAPPNTRVTVLIEGGRTYTGWFDTTDNRWRAISPWSGRPDIICGLTPIAWLPQ
jgi:hypothetical protein